MSISPRRRRAGLLAVVTVAVAALLASGLPAQADESSPDGASSSTESSPSADETPADETPTPGSDSTDSPDGSNDPDGTGSPQESLATFSTAPASNSLVFNTPRSIPLKVSGIAYGDYRVDLSLDGQTWKSGLAGQSLTNIPGYTGASFKVIYSKQPNGKYGNWVLYTPTPRAGVNTAPAYSHQVYYRVRTPSGSAHSNVSTLTGNVGSFCQSRRTPGATTWAAPTRFNYPFSSYYDQTAIKRQALAAINATPCGQTIQLAMFAINDGGYDTAKALYAAHMRGVNTQVMSDSHEKFGPDASASYKWLMAKLGYNPAQPLTSAHPAKSFAQVCIRACRGTSGNHHYKMLLISRTGQYTNYMMTGSANLTSKAAYGQWNHMDTVTCNYLTNAGCANAQALIPHYRLMFYQLVNRYRGGSYKTPTNLAPYTQFYPMANASPANDLVYNNLDAVNCTFGNGQRTTILIGQYAWFEDRGLWLAKKVRALWNSGCNVAIHYSVMGNTVKGILYSPSGRGRIPMRQVATYAGDGTIIDYDHSKYMVINGSINGRKEGRVISGTTNYNNMGFGSDDFTTIFVNDMAKVSAYATNFSRVYGGPHSRPTSPASRLPGELNTGRLTFGQGAYKNLDPA